MMQKRSFIRLFIRSFIRSFIDVIFFKVFKVFKVVECGNFFFFFFQFGVTYIFCQVPLNRNFELNHHLSPKIATVQIIEKNKTTELFESDFEFDLGSKSKFKSKCNCNIESVFKERKKKDSLFPSHASKPGELLGFFEFNREPNVPPSVVYVSATKGQKPSPVVSSAVQPSKKRFLKKALIIGGGTYLTWHLTWKICHNYFDFQPWLVMPNNFIESFQYVIQGQSGDVAHVPIIQEAFTEFLYSPNRKSIVEHKISHISANPQKYLRHLGMFCRSPLHWIDSFQFNYHVNPPVYQHQGAIRNRQLYRQFCQSFINMIELFDQDDQDIPKERIQSCLAYIQAGNALEFDVQHGVIRQQGEQLEFYFNSLRDFYEIFQGDPELFKFALKNFIIKFWHAVWRLNFRS